jgi:hypothetical protein
VEVDEDPGVSLTYDADAVVKKEDVATNPDGRALKMSPSEMY